jgi:sugar lactone lactonase YvrE
MKASGMAVHRGRRRLTAPALFSAAALILALPPAPTRSSTGGAAGVVTLNGDAYFPEGPIWHGGKLYYVEYGRNAVMTWDGHKNAVFSAEKGCGQSAVAPFGRDEFLTTCYDNGSIGRMAADGTVLPAYTHDKEGNGFLGPNDLAPDTHGGVYFTASGHLGAVSDGKVFYIAADRSITQVATGLHNANGLAVSRDGTLLYVVETEERRLLQFKIGATAGQSASTTASHSAGPAASESASHSASHSASLSERRVFVNLDDLVNHVAPFWPDGVKVSSKGELYVGQSPRDVRQPLVGQILVIDARGKLLRSLTLPSPKVPNLAFSPDEKTVYVTAVDQIDAPPYHGKVYAVPNE